MRFDDTKITPDTACWWPFARRQLLRKPHEILEAENKNKKQISASLCLATKQRYNLTYIKKIIYFCVWPCYLWNPLVRNSFTLLVVGGARKKWIFPVHTRKLQQDDELLPMDDKIFPWQFLSSVHLIAISNKHSLVFPSENSNALSEEIKINRSSAALLCSCFWQLRN